MQCAANLIKTIFLQISRGRVEIYQEQEKMQIRGGGSVIDVI